MEMTSVNRGLKSQRFTVFQAPLTTIESRVYEICRRCASAGVELDSQESIIVEVGFESPSSAADVMRRLETKGYIERRLFQKGRMVKICETGEWTAEPKNTAPHWRLRKESCPAPAIHQIRERARPLAQMIEAKARALGKPLHEFLIDCVYVGFNEIMHEGSEA
jgi:SOS-response transcriptional repressor LexA